MDEPEDKMSNYALYHAYKKLRDEFEPIKEFYIEHKDTIYKYGFWALLGKAVLKLFT